MNTITTIKAENIDRKAGTMDIVVTRNKTKYVANTGERTIINCNQDNFKEKIVELFADMEITDRLDEFANNRYYLEVE